jgi:hypothetical protein
MFSFLTYFFLCFLFCVCRFKAYSYVSVMTGIVYPHNITPLSSYVVKKYKPVTRKIRPVATELPERFHIVRNIKGDPLSTLPDLPTRPKPFEPTQRYTEVRKAIIDAAHPGEFLWPQERLLLHQFMLVHQDGFAWDDSERGHFKE